MFMKQGIPEIDRERCKGCGLCISNCPKKILAMAEDLNSHGAYYTVCIDDSQCIACGACALMCPDAAIEVFQIKEAV